MWTKNKIKIASIGEEKTMLKRAINSVSAEYSSFTHVLEKDSTSWLRVFIELRKKELIYQRTFRLILKKVLLIPNWNLLWKSYKKSSTQNWKKKI